MNSNELENHIHDIVSKIRCPECGDSFTLEAESTNGEQLEDVRPIEEKKACRDFKVALNEKLTRVRAESLSLSEFRSWAQRYSPI